MNNTVNYLFPELIWECFPKKYTIEKSGVFSDSSKLLEVTRDDDLRLKVIATGETYNYQNNFLDSKYRIYCTSELPNVKINNELFTGKIEGALVTNWRRKDNLVGDVKSILSEEAEPDKIELYSNQYSDCEQKELTEWLVNVNINGRFPCNTNFEIINDNGIIINIIKRNGQYIEKKYYNSADTQILPGGGGHRDNIELCVDGFHVLFGIALEQKHFARFSPGFLTYKNKIPNQIIRNKITTALSFTFGLPFSSIGHSVYTNNWDITKIVAKRIHLPIHIREAIAMHMMPPAPIIKNGVLDGDKISGILNRFVEKYDEYKFEQVMWQYWIACNSPADVAIERFFSIINGFAKGKCLLETGLWMPIKSDLLSILDKHENKIKKDNLADKYEDNDKTKILKNFSILKNKVQSNLNQAPISCAIKEFFYENDLEIGDLELDALRSRNSFSHGGMSKDHYKAIVFENVLRTLCNRIILHIIEVDNYIDYSSKNSNGEYCQKSVYEKI